MKNQLKKQKGDIFEQALLKDAITIFGNRKAAIKALVKGQKDYKIKKAENDMPWLINHLRQITSGVNNKLDKVYNYIQALWGWK
eukprot:1869173-Ditylum_brightwellii.AAC.1